MRDTYDKFTFQHSGMIFACEIANDDCVSAPWIEYDGHGEIRETRSHYGRPDKKPGEVILYSDGSHYWIYDFQGAVKRARDGGWRSYSCKPEMTKGQAAACAIVDDMKYCRDFLTGDRWHAVIEVYRVDADGERLGESQYLGAVGAGHRPGCYEYVRESAQALADDIAYEVRKAWRKALKEARERKYWAQRDVATVGVCHA